MERLIVVAVFLFSAVPAGAANWYMLEHDSARCVVARSPMELDQDFDKKKIPYHVFHYAERNGKPAIVKVLYNDGGQPHELLYFQDRSFCQEQAYLRTGRPAIPAKVTPRDQ